MLCLLQSLLGNAEQGGITVASYETCCAIEPVLCLLPQPASTFVVSLQDYYGNPGLAEYSGTCQVTYSGTVLTLPELGRSVDIYNGTGTFQQLTVEGQSLPSGP